jgi:hypothetical protein
LQPIFIELRVTDDNELTGIDDLDSAYEHAPRAPDPEPGSVFDGDSDFQEDEPDERPSDDDDDDFDDEDDDDDDFDDEDDDDEEDDDAGGDAEGDSESVEKDETPDTERE